MSKVKYTHEIANGSKRVKVENDGYSTTLFFMSNGYQWAGAPINKELAEMAIKALNQYIQSDVDNI